MLAAILVVLQQLPGFNAKCARNARDVIDRYIAFSSLDGAEVSAVDTRIVGQRFLRQPAGRAQSSHIFRENIAEGTLVRPFHSRRRCQMTVLRRPLLRYIHHK